MTNDLLHQAVLLLSALAASSGLWAFVASTKNKKTATDRMLLGLGHDRIVYLCKIHVAAGCISTEDFENLNYLYEPYKALGGNGTAEKYMNDVRKLPNVAEHEHVPHKPAGVGRPSRRKKVL